MLYKGYRDVQGILTVFPQFDAAPGSAGYLFFQLEPPARLERSGNPEPGPVGPLGNDAMGSRGSNPLMRAFALGNNC